MVVSQYALAATLETVRERAGRLEREEAIAAIIKAFTAAACSLNLTIPPELEAVLGD